MKIFKKIYFTILSLFITIFMVGCDTADLLKEAKERIDSTEERTNDLEERIEELETQMVIQEGLINSQNSTILLQATQILQNADKILLLETTIQVLNQSIEIQNAYLLSLETTIETNSVLLSNSVLRISDLEDKLALLDTMLDQVILSVGGLEATQETMGLLITSYGTSIESINTTIIALQTQLEDIQQQVGYGQEDIDEIMGTIEMLQSSLESHVIIYESMQNVSTNLEARINSLSNAILSLEVITGLSMSYEQDEYSLQGVLNISLPTLSEASGYEYIGANLTINHPLKGTVTGNSFVQQILMDYDQISVPISMLYHGAYSGILEFKYSNGTNLNKYTYEIDLPFISDHYNIAWLNATMPLLLFASDVLTGFYDNGFTYIEIERARTFDYTKLPSNVKPIPAYASPSLGNYNQTSVPNFLTSIDPRTNSAHAINWIEELYSLNSNSTFTFATVDNVSAVITGVYMSSVPISQVDFIVYTDGSFTTQMLNTAYGGTEGFINYGYRTTEFLDWANRIDSGQITTSFNTHYILPALEHGNLKYVINSSAGLQFNAQMMQKFDSLDVRITSAIDSFSSVEVSNKLNELEYLLKTRWGDAPEQSMSVYFNGTPEKNLLILGTSPTAEANANYASFDNYINYIISNYASEYKIFYKGHPSYPSSEPRKAMFLANNIVELPNSIPVETLMLLYHNVFVGGYTSTSFQSSLVNQTIFFFGPQSLIEGNATLKSMILAEIIFENTVFLIKDSNGNVIVQ